MDEQKDGAPVSDKRINIDCTYMTERLCWGITWRYGSGEGWMKEDKEPTVGRLAFHTGLREMEEVKKTLTMETRLTIRLVDTEGMSLL